MRPVSCSANCRLCLSRRHARPGPLAVERQRELRRVGEVEREVVGAVRADAGARREHALRRLAERDRDDARALGHALAGAQVERHAGPPPVVDLAPQRDERLGVGVRADAGLVEVAVVLPAHHLRRLDRAQRAEHLVLLLADRPRLERGRRLHRHEREHLEQVVHDHVAVRAGLLVEADALPDRRASRARRSARARCAGGSRSARRGRSRTGTPGC